MSLRSSFFVLPSAVATVADGSITAAKLAPGAVTAGAISPGAVTSSGILDGTIAAVDVGAGALTGTQIAVNSVPADRIQNLSVTPAMLQHPMGLQDQDYSGTAPGRLSGSKVDPPVRQIVQFNNTAMPAENYLNFLGTAGLLQITDDPANARTNINLQGIITNAPAKGVDADVLAVGGQAGNTIGSNATWAAGNHGHQLLAVPITGLYGNHAALPFAAAAGGTADATIQRTGAQQLAVDSTVTITPAAGQFHLVAAGIGGSTGIALNDGNVFIRRDASNYLLLNDSVGHVIAQVGAGQAFIVSSGGGLKFVADGSCNAYPGVDNTGSSGTGGNRWTAVYAVNGTIQTSDPAQKANAAPVDPAAALVDVLAAQIIAYELPAPTEEAPHGTMLHVGFSEGPARLFVGRRATPGDDVVTSLEVEPNTTGSLAMAAVQGLHAQVVALEARIAALEAAPGPP